MEIIQLENAADLKKYSDREGFVIKFSPPSKKTDSSDIDQALIKIGVVDVEPEFVYSCEGIWAFVYPENTYFDIHLFYEIAEGQEAARSFMMAGRGRKMWDVDGLQKVIKSIP